MKNKYIMGTRGSRLALAQSAQYLKSLEEKYPHVCFETKIIKTTGDKNQTTPLNKIGDKGIFTKELEHALLARDIDFAVHSMKDMPSVLPEGLMLAPAPKREDPADVLITAKPIESLKDLGAVPVIGTGSLRREAQIRALLPDCEIRSIRGNVDTRIRKLLNGDYDAILLAAAGLNRLGLTHMLDGRPFYVLRMEPEAFIPAPAQGILAAEIREEDQETYAMLSGVSDAISVIQMRTERSFLEAVEGSCSVPVGAFAKVDGSTVHVSGVFGNEACSFVQGDVQGDAKEPEKTGRALAELLLNRLAEK